MYFKKLTRKICWHIHILGHYWQIQYRYIGLVMHILITGKLL